jgi:hypothetical protein
LSVSDRLDQLFGRFLHWLIEKFTIQTGATFLTVTDKQQQMVIFEFRDKLFGTKWALFVRVLDSSYKTKFANAHPGTPVWFRELTEKEMDLYSKVNRLPFPWRHAGEKFFLPSKTANFRQVVT